MLIPRLALSPSPWAALLAGILTATLSAGCGGGGGSGGALKPAPNPGSTTPGSGSGTGTTPGTGTGTGSGTGTTPGTGSGSGTGTTPGTGSGTGSGSGSGTGTTPTSPAVVQTLAPTSGVPGVVVVAQGSGFGSSPSVSVDGSSARVLAASATSVSFTIPDTTTAGSQNVVITGPAGSSSPQPFSVSATAPTTRLVRIDPPGGAANQIVTVRGIAFGSTPPPTVQFNGITASQVTFSDASVAVRVPASLATGFTSVTVTPAGATSSSNAVVFTVSAQVSAGQERFQALVPLSSPRSGHSATLLQDGRVLIVGGDSSGQLTTVNTAEIFDPQTLTFKPLASRMSVSRQGHTATLLPDGRVLIAGGFSGPAVAAVGHASTELFDPDTETFTPGPALLEPRDAHVAVSLANGDVVLAGGEGPDPVFGQFFPINTSEFYRFTPGAPGGVVAGPVTNLARLQTAAVPSFGGAVLVGGLDNGGELASAESLDQVRFRWTAGTSATGMFIMTVPRALPTLTRLANGDLAAIGGYSPTGIATLLGVDPMTTADVMPTEPTNPNVGIFGHRSFPSLPARVAHSTTMLADDRILVVGSAASLSAASSAAIFDAALTSGRATQGSPQHPRLDHTATLLFDGRVLLVGGGGDASQIPGVFGASVPVTNTTEIFTP